jgi:hypothetical protein
MNPFPCPILLPLNINVDQTVTTTDIVTTFDNQHVINLSLSHEPLTDHQLVSLIYQPNILIETISTSSMQTMYHNVPQACIIPYTIRYT